MILSASRRTDIPGYYSQWFVNRLKEGYVLSRNPMNLAQVSKILLTPEYIDCIVFWTKDPAPMLEQLTVIDALGFPYYFQFTITPYERNIERNLRDKKDIVNTFKELSEILGKERMLWRYDPILLNEEFTIPYHLDNFSKLCKELNGYTDVCTISFVDLYKKLSKTVKETVVRSITEEEMHLLAKLLSEIAGAYGIEVRACCEQLDLSKEGIKSASCIDKEIVERVCGHAITGKKDKNQRPGCGCIQSVDIGVYNTCKNGCVYCYANHSDESIRKNYLLHDPKSDILIGSVQESDKIKIR
jgi:hypothetical protein